MSSTDKAKLDGIASGANNYKLPTASANTLGGIKTGYNDTADASKLAVKVDNNGNAYVTISGLSHNLCKFNFINSISECVNGKINFLITNSDTIDMSFIDDLKGVILLVCSSN